MNIFAYTSDRNPHAAAEIVSSYGMRPARDKHTLSRQLAFVVKQNGTRALGRVAEAHPDFDLFSNYFGELQKSQEKTQEKGSWSNACGCSGFSNADGGGTTSNNAQGANQFSKSELLIAGGIFLIGLTLVLKLTTGK